eukprot:scaffold18514_cov112-Isochrysis_galbana.AAC.2
MERKRWLDHKRGSSSGRKRERDRSNLQPGGACLALVRQRSARAAGRRRPRRDVGMSMVGYLAERIVHVVLLNAESR